MGAHPHREEIARDDIIPLAGLLAAYVHILRNALFGKIELQEGAHAPVDGVGLGRHRDDVGQVQGLYHAHRHIGKKTREADEHGARAKPFLLELHHEARAVAHGHEHVDERNVGLLVFSEIFKRLIRVIRFRANLESFVGVKEFRERIAHTRIIIDKKNPYYFHKDQIPDDNN